MEGARTGTSDGELLDAQIDRAFREYSPALWRAIYVYTGGCRDLAEEAVAEAFTRAVRQWATIEDPRSWLYRVSFRIAGAELKRERREAPQQTLRLGVSDPEEVRAVLDALTALPPKQRAAVVLHYRLDMSVRDVAKALDITTATVAEVMIQLGVVGDTTSTQPETSFVPPPVFEQPDFPARAGL